MARKSMDTSNLPRVALTILKANDHSPLTSTVSAGLGRLNHKGALLYLDAAFIDGVHVVMDVHNITPKLAEVRFPDDSSQVADGRSLLGSIVCYDLLYGPAGSNFLLELEWVSQKEKDHRGLKNVKRLLKQAKTAVPAEA